MEQGFDLYLLNRGKSKRVVPESVHILHGDIRDIESVRQALGDIQFDVVVDWIAFSPEHIETDLHLFRDRTQQYIFISSASVYQTPPQKLPVTENTPLENPFWEYSRAKIACEKLLFKAYREEKFPVTIVRPSHTYDRTTLPFSGGFTVLKRMMQGKKVIVHGDGSSLWVLTHHSDFAKGFVGLLANKRTIGEAFHITSDELLTWNQIFEIIARAAGTKAQIIHIPSDVIARFNAEWGAGLLGDKAHSMIFDNSKIKSIVPEYAATITFSRGVEEIIEWYNDNPDRQIVDNVLDKQMDEIIAAYQDL